MQKEFFGYGSIKKLPQILASRKPKLIFLVTGKLDPKTLFIGKVTTVAQMAALLSTLLWLPREWTMALYFAAVAFTFLSAFFYIRAGSRLFQGQS